MELLAAFFHSHAKSNVLTHLCLFLRRVSGASNTISFPWWHPMRSRRAGGLQRNGPKIVPESLWIYSGRTIGAILSQLRRRLSIAPLVLREHDLRGDSILFGSNPMLFTPSHTAIRRVVGAIVERAILFWFYACLLVIDWIGAWTGEMLARASLSLERTRLHTHKTTSRSTRRFKGLQTNLLFITVFGVMDNATNSPLLRY